MLEIISEEAQRVSPAGTLEARVQANRQQKMFTFILTQLKCLNSSCVIRNRNCEHACSSSCCSPLVVDEYRCSFYRNVM